MVAINNRAPGWKDEARICSDRLAQVDGWQCEGINESTGPPTHGDGSSADGLMSSLYGSVCRAVCAFVYLCETRWKMALESDWTSFFLIFRGRIWRKMTLKY